MTFSFLASKGPHDAIPQLCHSLNSLGENVDFEPDLSVGPVVVEVSDLNRKVPFWAELSIDPFMLFNEAMSSLLLPPKHWAIDRAAKTMSVFLDSSTPFTTIGPLDIYRAEFTGARKLYIYSQRMTAVESQMPLVRELAKYGRAPRYHADPYSAIEPYKYQDHFDDIIPELQMVLTDPQAAGFKTKFVRFVYLPIYRAFRAWDEDQTTEALSEAALCADRQWAKAIHDFIKRSS